MPNSASSSVDPTTFNPVFSVGDYLELQIILMLFERPIARDALTGRWVPRLAESFEIREGGRIFDMTLRPDLSWSDGSPLTSEDVVYTIENLYLDEEFGAGLIETAKDLGDITVSVIDDRRYRIESERPSRVMWDIVSLAPLPRDVIEKWAETNGWYGLLDLYGPYSLHEPVVGSGAFVLHEYVEGESITLRRNPYYFEEDEWGTQLPYLDEVVFLPLAYYGDEEYEVADHFLEGRVDTAPGDLENRTLQWLDDTHLAVYSAYGTGTQLLLVNQSIPTDSNPYGVGAPTSQWLRNHTFRRALASLIDRDKINRQVTGGTATPSWTFRPLSYYAYPNNGIVPDYDPDAAEEILDNLGWIDSDGDGIREDPAGNPVRLRILVNTPSDRERGVATIVEAFTGAGIDAVPLLEPWSQYVVRLTQSGDWDLALIGIGGDSQPLESGAGWDGYFGTLSALPYANADPPASLLETLSEVIEEWPTTVVDADIMRLNRQAQIAVDSELTTMYLLASAHYTFIREPIGNFYRRIYDRQIVSLERAFLPTGSND